MRQTQDTSSLFHTIFQTSLSHSPGENMKQLEKSAEKAVEREEKLKDKILQIQQKFKAAEGRSVQQINLADFSKECCGFYGFLWIRVDRKNLIIKNS